MEIQDVKSLMSEVWQAGYMEAVKAYEPARDIIRKSELKGWLGMMHIDARTFHKIEKSGLVRSHKLGRGKNSPLVYSKTEIKKALATRTALRLYINDVMEK